MGSWSWRRRINSVRSYLPTDIDFVKTVQYNYVIYVLVIFFVRDGVWLVGEAGGWMDSGTVVWVCICLVGLGPAVSLSLSLSTTFLGPSPNLLSHFMMAEHFISCSNWCSSFGILCGNAYLPVYLRAGDLHLWHLEYNTIRTEYKSWGNWCRYLCSVDSVLTKISP